MWRVLVVDDQVLIRAGLAALMRAAPGVEVVGEAADGEQALAVLAEREADVVLMDLRMPGMGGIAATEQIVAARDAAGRQTPRVLILTTFDLDDYVYAALKAGASGFVLKDTPPDRLLAAITVVAHGDMLFSPSISERLVEAYTLRGEAMGGPAPDLALLTAREVEVLRLVGKGMTNPEIADHLVVGETTVKTHLSRTMTKLGLSTRAQAVVVAYETGLVVPGDGGGRGGG
ncbi:response regulator transcription factor [Catenulispora yoronensis]|uniref:Response regulator transcription factor n=1 Tax=Catenulispora yoronensis TaxID=450799 RepID=A0ABN2VC99_9ACTN